jgi:hypothetical protein
VAQGDPRTTGYAKGTPDTYLGSREATRLGPGGVAVDIQEVTMGLIGPYNGRKLVVVTGTPVAIAASTPARLVIPQALDTNTGIIVVGGISSGVGGALDYVAATRNGIALPSPYDTAEFCCTNLTDIIINGAAGDGVSFLYWTL